MGYASEGEGGEWRWWAKVHIYTYIFVFKRRDRGYKGRKGEEGKEINGKGWGMG
jgi:hypothetical protein